MAGSAARISRNGDSTMIIKIRWNASGSKSVDRRHVLDAGIVHQHVDVQLQVAERLRIGTDRAARTSPPMSAATAPARSSSMSATVTFAPRAASRRATAAPIPLAPPVTRADRPASSPAESAEVRHDRHLAAPTQERTSAG